MNYTFEQLPEAMSVLHDKLDNIERLLLKGPPNNKEEKELLSIQQASELINLSVPTIYSKVSRREIPFCKKGKRLYFSTEELLDWIKSGRHQTQLELLESTQDRLSRIKRKRI